MKNSGEVTRRPPKQKAGTLAAILRVKPLRILLVTTVPLMVTVCDGGKDDGSPTEPETFEVTVDLSVLGSGNGSGQVSGAQLACQIEAGQAAASGCQQALTFNSGNLPTTLNLVASPSPGSAFVTWAGFCASAGSSTTCPLTITSVNRTWVITAIAQFELLPGSIQVSTVTGGSDLDPDGYTVTIGQTNVGTIGANDVQTYSNLDPGSHTLILSDVADNCTVDGANPRTLTVNPGATTQTTFNIDCEPTTGTVEVTTVTKGEAGDLDDAYTLTLDQGNSSPLGVNATQAFPGLSPGNHTVALGDIAANCSLDDGENPRTLAVTAGQTTSTTFDLTCAPPAGGIRITTVTGGKSLPEEDFSVSVNQGPGSPIGINASITVSPLPPGVHEVALSGVPGNCRITGENPRSVTVPPGGTAETVFGVQCLQTHLLAFQRVSERGDTDICVLDPVIGESSVVCLTGGQDDPLGNAADEVHPTWGPSYTELIFASDRDGDFELFSRDMFSGELTQLTHNTSYDSEPDYYVTGGKVLFTSDRSGNKDIWLLEFQEEANLESQLTTDPAPDFNPAWAYDSGAWLFTSTRQGDMDIWRGGAGPIGQQTLGPFNDDDAAWLPPNFFFASDRNGSWDVFRESTWTGREVLLEGTSDEFGPTPGPDGLWVAFTTNKDGDFEIYKKHLITGELVRLTVNSSEDSNPAWFAWLF